MPLQIGLQLFASLLLLSFILYRWHNQRGRNPNRLAYPPGPKGYPLIGSYFSIPKEQHWLKFKKYSDTYGDIVFIRSLRMNYLILDSVERINDLLEKRSAHYSDRGGVTMLLDLMRWDFNFAFVPYGEWWRRQRKVFHDYFSPIVIEKYDEIQTREIHAFLNRLLQTPNDFQEHIPMTFAAITMQVVYGIRIPFESKNNPYVTAVREAFSGGLAVAGIPGMHLVDHLPILKHIPAWFPGAEFQRVAKRARDVVQEVTVTRTLDRVRKDLVNGTQATSMVAELLGNIPLDSGAASRKEEELLIQYVAGVSYAAGADTTASSIAGFFLAMAMFPAAQKKAQQEIDTVTGNTRLPVFHDRDSMPYMEALILELMRWHPVAPLAVPHISSRDDEYDGFFIPKGTVVIPNVWSILNDPEIFPDPSKFDPDRYLNNPSLRSPVEAGFFGYGRRLCPGRFFSNRNIFTVITAVLSVFDILPPLNEHGDPLPLKYGATTGIVSYPNPFTCRIVPRSDAATKLILEAQLQWQS
ncbi:cytochrome P450 [Panaeolus papilionaceus]|nr:cytochrome P450 [Panaeolus papilionaceus]